MAKDRGSIRGGDDRIDQFMLTGLVVCLLVCVTVISQVLLVKAGHPEAVWMWCDMARLCA